MQTAREPLAQLDVLASLDVDNFAAEHVLLGRSCAVSDLPNAQ